MSGDTCQNPLFRPLNADDPDPEATEIESLCMNCYAKGVTRLLLTNIPFYKDVVIFSFTCEECGYQNNEIQSSGPVAEKGIRYTLNVQEAADLNRKVVKSDYASIKIIEVEFEIPPQTQKGEITTVEGIVERSIRGLEQDQPTRREEHPDLAKEVDEFLVKLKDLRELKSPFQLVLEDISGNSFVENPNAPQKDPRCTCVQFRRTSEQDHMLGIYAKSEIQGENDGVLHPIAEDELTLEQLEKDEVLSFETNCHGCRSPCQTNMKVTHIPYFKEVVIMATNCEVCGLRTNEVKSGSGIEPKGLRIEVQVSEPADFTRDILKSETCSLEIPELELQIGSTTLGGRFSTIEGLLTSIKDQLTNTEVFNDSNDEESESRMKRFMEDLNSVLDGKKSVTIILDDPAGNSYVQKFGDPDEQDTKLKIIHYERTSEQNEELGLNDMKVENYEEQPTGS